MVHHFNDFQVFEFSINLMHNWGANNATLRLAPRYQGHSLSDQCYKFCLSPAHPATLLSDEWRDPLLGEEGEAARHHVSKVIHPRLPAVLAQPAP